MPYTLLLFASISSIFSYLSGLLVGSHSKTNTISRRATPILPYTVHIDLDERAFDLPEQRRNESVPNDLKSITIEVNNRFDLVSIRSSNTCAECLKILANGFQFSYQ